MRTGRQLDDACFVVPWWLYKAAFLYGGLPHVTDIQCRPACCRSGILVGGDFATGFVRTNVYITISANAG